MANALPHHHIDTYSRVVISNYAALNSLLSRRTTTIKDQINNQKKDDNQDMPVILTVKQMDDALNGPYALFLSKMLSSFSLIAFLQHKLIQFNDEIFQSTEDESARPFSATREQLKKMSAHDLETLESKINTLMHETDDAWCDLMNESCQILIEGFQQINIQLAESNVQDMNNQYTISELAERLRHMETPVQINKNNPSPLSTYFSYKCRFAIYNYLGRVQEQNDNKNIEKHFKSFKKAIDSIKTKEQALVNQLQSNIDAITKPFDFVIKEKN